MGKSWYSIIKNAECWERPDHNKGCGGWQNVCMNFIDIVDGFLSFLF